MVQPGEVQAQGGGWGPPGGGFPGAPGGHAPGGHAPGGHGYGGAAPPPKPITGGKETMALHAMSIDPSTGLPVGETPPSSTAAVISLVFGALLCLPFAGVPAIGAGMMGYLAARREPRKVGGSTMAMVGIGLGVLNLLGWSLGGVLWVLSLLV